MNETRSNTENSAVSIISWVVAFGMGYAILRYHIAGPVPWKDLSFFILNKGISLSAFILLAMNFAFGPAKNIGLPVPAGWLSARMAIGTTGFLLVLVHVLMSLLLFSPAIYGKFFSADATLTLIAGLSMFTGVLAFVVLWGYNLSFKTTLREDKAFIQFITSRKFLLWALLLGAAHIFFMGISGTSARPARRPGGGGSPSRSPRTLRTSRRPHGPRRSGTSCAANAAGCRRPSSRAGCGSACPRRLATHRRRGCG